MLDRGGVYRLGRGADRDGGRAARRREGRRRIAVSGVRHEEQRSETYHEGRCGGQPHHGRAYPVRALIEDDRLRASHHADAQPDRARRPQELDDDVLPGVDGVGPEAERFAHRRDDDVDVEQLDLTPTVEEEERRGIAAVQNGTDAAVHLERENVDVGIRSEVEDPQTAHRAVWRPSRLPKAGHLVQ